MNTLRVPLLANGDHLTRVEFERRYAAMPEHIKAELIDGVVYMASPVNLRDHGKPHAILGGWLGYFMAKTPGLEFGDNSTVRLADDNEPQPDLLLLLPPHVSDRAHVGADGYVYGPPGLICEIAASSVSLDLHAKKRMYRRHGVSEYLVWRTEDAAIDWWILGDSDYIPIAPRPDGTLCSPTFPGLCLRPESLLAGDLPALFAALDHATAAPDHADFVARLKSPPL